MFFGFSSSTSSRHFLLNPNRWAALHSVKYMHTLIDPEAKTPWLHLFFFPQRSYYSADFPTFFQFYLCQRTNTFVSYNFTRKTLCLTKVLSPAPDKKTRDRKGLALFKTLVFSTRQFVSSLTLSTTAVINLWKCLAPGTSLSSAYCTALAHQSLKYISGITVHQRYSTSALALHVLGLFRLSRTHLLYAAFLRLACFSFILNLPSVLPMHIVPIWIIH